MEQETTAIENIPSWAHLYKSEYTDQEKYTNYPFKKLKNPQTYSKSKESTKKKTAKTKAEINEAETSKKSKRN